MSQQAHSGPIVGFMVIVGLLCLFTGDGGTTLRTVQVSLGALSAKRREPSDPHTKSVAFGLAAGVIVHA